MQLLRRLFRLSPPLAAHLRAGQRGEQAAVAYLKRHGFTIHARNVRIGKHDEIDIVAFDPVDKVIVFAEVKTRTRADPDFRPELNLTRDKRHRMARAARRWIVQHRWQGGYRLDLLCVIGTSVSEHYREVAWQ